MSSQVLYAPINKVEEQPDGTLHVFGVASSEREDSDGEVVLAEAMRKALPDYLTFGAVREMHGASAAGTALEASVDDEGMTHFGAHIVDPVAVLKVNTGVYKGFSIGGKITKRDPKNKKVIEALKLVEISLVDRPANPDAIMTLVKFDSSGAVVAGKRGKTKGSSSTESTMTKAAGEKLEKSMYDVRQLADVVTSVFYLCQNAIWERDGEKDASGMPDTLKQICLQMCGALCEMVDEETAELLGILGIANADDLLEAAEKAAKAGDLAKRGSKFSKSVAGRLEEMHDMTKAMCDHFDALGYAAADNPEDTDMADKTASADDLAKAHTELGALRKTDEIQKAEITSLTEKLTKAEADKTAAEAERDELAAGVAEIVSSATAKGVLRVVGKADDSASIAAGGAAPAAVEKPTDAQAEIKKSWANPRDVMPPRAAART